MEELLTDNRIFKDRRQCWESYFDIAKDTLFQVLWYEGGYTLWLRKIYNYENYKNFSLKYL